MDVERYGEMNVEARERLSAGLCYGFASAVLWEMVNSGEAEMDIDRVCEISTAVIETAPDKLAEEERARLLYDLREFDAATEARIALLAADTDKVKSYVFESPRLPEMRGGSLILDNLNKKELIKARVLDSYNLPEDCIIYSSGGSILIFVPASLRHEIAGLIEKQYLEETITATMTAVSEIFSYSQFCFGLDLHSDDPKGFGGLVDLMAYKIRRAKQERKYVPFCETVPFARHCDSCGVRPASDSVSVGAKVTHLCISCHEKQRVGRSNRGYLLKTIGELPYDRISEKIGFDPTCCVPPDSLETIADVPNDGFIGLIYADGNGIGKEMEKLSTCNEYKKFAQDMLESTSVEICQALAAPRFIRRDNQYGVEMLCALGSDDVMAVVPGKYALQLAINMCRAFERRMASYGAKMSAGVVIAPYNYPMYYLEEVCEQLLKNAKVKSRKSDNAATIDFWAITSQDVMASDVENYRKQLMEINLYAGDPMSDRLVLYERPYTLDRLQSLLDWARRFRSEGFPVSQLYGLRQVLEEGRLQANLYYLYQLSRMSRENRGLMHDFARYCCSHDAALFPWNKNEKSAGYMAYSTCMVDLLEIYNLAEEV